MKLTVTLGRVDKNYYKLYASGLNRLLRIGILTFHSLPRARGGGAGTPYNGLYGEAPPKGVPLSGFRYIQGGGEFCPLTHPLGLH